MTHGSIYMALYIVHVLHAAGNGVSGKGGYGRNGNGHYQMRKRSSLHRVLGAI